MTNLNNTPGNIGKQDHPNSSVRNYILGEIRHVIA